MTKNEAMEKYSEFKAAGFSQKEATKKTIYLGASFDDAVDACWMVETGKYAPSGSVYGGDSAAAHASRAPSNQE